MEGGEGVVDKKRFDILKIGNDLVLHTTPYPSFGKGGELITTTITTNGRPAPTETLKYINVGITANRMRQMFFLCSDKQNKSV